MLWEKKNVFFLCLRKVGKEGFLTFSDTLPFFSLA